MDKQWCALTMHLLCIYIVCVCVCVCVHVYHTVFFPAYTRQVSSTSFLYGNSFDVAVGPAQIMPSHHALNFARGEHWYGVCVYYMYVMVCVCMYIM